MATYTITIPDSDDPGITWAATADGDGLAAADYLQRTVAEMVASWQRSNVNEQVATLVAGLQQATPEQRAAFVSQVNAQVTATLKVQSQAVSTQS